MGVDPFVPPLGGGSLCPWEWTGLGRDGGGHDHGCRTRRSLLWTHGGTRRVRVRDPTRQVSSGRGVRKEERERTDLVGTTLPVRCKTGSKNLRMGLATETQPISVPHLVAYRCYRKDSDRQTKEKTQRGDVEREEATRTVEVEVRGRITTVSKGNPRDLQRQCERVHDEEDEGFQWTNTEGKDGKTKRFLCGEEAVHLPPDAPYALRRPMYAGRLNASCEGDVRKVCGWMVDAWTWVLETKLKLDKHKRKELGAVLILPDVMARWEAKEMVNLVLKELEFGSIVVHQESLAALFGHGSISGCVVSMGAQSTTVCCVEDGVALPETRVTFDFGGDQITQYLHWLLVRAKVWPCPEVEPDATPLDCETLDRLKETYCTYGTQEDEIPHEAQFYVHEVGQLARRYSVSMTNARDIALMAYFSPKVLHGLAKGFAVDPAAPYEKHQDPEVVLEEFAGTDAYTQKPVNAGILPPLQEANGDDTSEEPACTRVASPWVDTKLAEAGLHMAIVESILRCTRIDLQQKLFANIILVGGGASPRGLADVLEEKVLYGIPRDVSVETVNVLTPKMDCQTSVWFGGALLGTLDFARDTWLTREEWVEGGPMVGTARKYSATTDVLSQAMSFMRW